MKQRTAFRILLALGAVAGVVVWILIGGRKPVSPVKLRFQGYTRVSGHQTQFAAFVVTNESRSRIQFQWSAVVDDGNPAASDGPGRGVVPGNQSVEFWVFPPELDRPWRLEATASGHVGAVARLRLRCATLCANWGLRRLASRIAPGAPQEFSLPAVPVPPAP